MKKILILLFTIFCITNFLFSNEYQRYILDNGLELYVIQDNTNPNSTVFYVNQAGFSAQNPENTGYFELYSNLFWKTNPKFENESQKILMSNIEKNIMNDQSVFNYSVPTDFLEESIKLLSQQLKNPVYNTEILKESFLQMKEKIHNFQIGPEGFINGAIDLQIYPDSPWKQRTAINPSLFKNFNSEKIRSILKSIADNYYVPNKSAIIITSCYTPNEILTLTKKYFNDWKSAITQNDESKNLNLEKSKNKKFILLSDDFSKELTQIVVQYVPENFFENQKTITSGRMATFALEENNSRLKQQLVRNETLGILSEEYVNVNFSYQGLNSRIIIQSLLQNTNISPMEQSKIFTQIISDSVNFNQFDVDSAVRKIKGQTKLANDSSVQFAKSLAYNWSYEKNDFTNSVQNLAQQITSSEMKECFSSTPYVFLLMHPSIYSMWKSENQNSNFSLITQENAYWYKHKKYNNIAKNFNIEDVEVNQNSIAQRIINSARNNSGKFTLNNGIEVDYSLNSENSTASIMLCFEGGEKIYPKKYRGMETILLKTLAKLVEIEIQKAYEAGVLLDTGHIEVSSGINKGNFILSCTSQDFPIMLGCINNGILFGQITPAMEDELVYMEKSKWRYLNNMLDFQLKTKALTSFYKGSNFEHLFSCTSDILHQLTFNEIRAMYTSLINSSRISIIVTGNPELSLNEEDDSATLKKYLNNYFGSMKALPFETKNLPQPQFTQMTQVSRLKRIFTTNIKAEDAGPRPEKLIPTTEFFDPALLILQSPKKESEQYYLYSLAMRGFEKFIKEDEQKNKHFSDLEIIYFEETDGFIALQFYEVKNATELYKYIEKKFIEYSKQITTTSSEEFSILKTYWASKEISEINTSEKLVKKIWSAKKLQLPALFHINQYEKISNLSLETYKTEFATNISSYFVDIKPYWIFSADTKR